VGKTKQNKTQRKGITKTKTEKKKNERINKTLEPYIVHCNNYNNKQLAY